MWSATPSWLNGYSAAWDGGHYSGHVSTNLSLGELHPTESSKMLPEQCIRRTPCECEASQPTPSTVHLRILVLRGFWPCVGISLSYSHSSQRSKMRNLRSLKWAFPICGLALALGFSLTAM